MTTGQSARRRWSWGLARKQSLPEPSYRKETEILGYGSLQNLRV